MNNLKLELFLSRPSVGETMRISPNAHGIWGMLLSLVLCLPSPGQQSKSKARATGDGAQPTLAETETWIIQTFEEGKHFHPYFEDHASQHIGFPGIDKRDGTQCFMSSEVWNNDADDNLAAYWKHEIPMRFDQLIDLADIDPGSIKAGDVRHDPATATGAHSGPGNGVPPDWQDTSYVLVTITTTNSKDRILTRSYNNSTKNETTRSMEHEAGFSNPDGGIAVKPDYAPRFIKALRHAVELCGGRRSTF
jgi:hypothetical protein